MVSSEGKEFVTLRELEGVHSTHDISMNRTINARRGPLDGFKDIAGMASWIGGCIDNLGLGETWTIRKELFPGVDVYFVYNEADDEFPSSLKIIYSGERIRLMPGEDLSEASIFIVNHMIRYVRSHPPAPFPPGRG